MDEEPLQRAILAAINSIMGNQMDMARQIFGATEQVPIPRQTISMADIQRRLDELEGRFNTLLEQMDG